MARRISIIFLHGLGDSGDGWASLPNAFRHRGGAAAWRWAFPSAPPRAVTLAPGHPMPAWFDLDALPVTKRTPDDAPGFAASAARVHALIAAEEAKGFLARDIFLGGFSQGAALALWAGLTYPSALGGVIALSGWLRAADLAALATPAARASRVLLCHGAGDDKVDFERGAAARDALRPLVREVVWREFDGGHEFAQEEAAWIHAFIEGAPAGAPILHAGSE